MALSGFVTSRWAGSILEWVDFNHDFGFGLVHASIVVINKRGGPTDLQISRDSTLPLSTHTLFKSLWRRDPPSASSSPSFMIMCCGGSSSCCSCIWKDCSRTKRRSRSSITINKSIKQQQRSSPCSCGCQRASHGHGRRFYLLSSFLLGLALIISSREGGSKTKIS